MTARGLQEVLGDVTMLSSIGEPQPRIRHWLFSVLALLLVCPALQGGNRNYQSGVMIDTAEYDWCHHDCAPFDRPTFFFCVQIGDQILIGSHKADWLWTYDSSQMLRFKGKPVSLRFDDHSMWIIRTDGKDMHLSRDYSQDVFARPECVAEIHRHWLHQFGQLKRPDTVPSDAVLVPQGTPSFFRRTGRHFWVTCAFDSQTSQDLCEMWDEEGVKYKIVGLVDSSNRKPVPQTDLLIDPLTTKVDYEIHLKNGGVLKRLGD